jgi:hypothetical protein
VTLHFVYICSRYWQQVLAVLDMRCTAWQAPTKRYAIDNVCQYSGNSAAMLRSCLHNDKRQSPSMMSNMQDASKQAVNVTCACCHCCRYVYPTYYAPVMDHAYDFGPNKNVQLVY